MKRRLWPCDDNDDCGNVDGDDGGDGGDSDDVDINHVVEMVVGYTCQPSGVPQLRQMALQ